MNLDDLAIIQSLDRSGRLESILALPDGMERAYRAVEPPQGLAGASALLICGVGEAILGADLLEAAVEGVLPLAMVVRREDSLPDWAQGKDTLVILLSFPGALGEDAVLLEDALARNCRVAVIGPGGRLIDAARRTQIQAWEMPADLPAALLTAWCFGTLLGVLAQAGYLPAPEDDLAEAVQAMRRALPPLLPAVGVSRNPAKRLAGQLFGRQTILFAAEYLAPVARLWKARINQMGKAFAQFELIPEADYNTLAGFENPSAVLSGVMTIFLRGSAMRPLSLQRLDLTRQMCLQMGINTDFVDARGESRMAQVWTSVLFAELTAYYLGLAYGVDPGQVGMLDEFLSVLAQIRE